MIFSFLLFFYKTNYGHCFFIAQSAILNPSYCHCTFKDLPVFRNGIIYMIFWWKGINISEVACDTSAPDKKG